MHECIRNKSHSKTTTCLLANKTWKSGRSPAADEKRQLLIRAASHPKLEHGNRIGLLQRTKSGNEPKYTARKQNRQLI